MKIIFIAKCYARIAFVIHMYIYFIICLYIAIYVIFCKFETHFINNATYVDSFAILADNKAVVFLILNFNFSPVIVVLKIYVAIHIVMM